MTIDDLSFLVQDDAGIRRILEETHTIAVVGLSGNPLRASHDVASYLQANGYRIVPVNPNETVVLGECAYASIRDLPRDLPVDLACIFRRSEEVAYHVDEILARGGIRSLWLQDGVVDA